MCTHVPSLSDLPSPPALPERCPTSTELSSPDEHKTQFPLLGLRRPPAIHSTHGSADSSDLISQLCNLKEGKWNPREFN